MTEELYYIKLHKNGCFVHCAQKDAQGIVFKGDVYALMGGNGLKGKPFVMPERVDGGGKILETIKAQESMEDAMCEQDAGTSSLISALEDAICELDKLLNA